jgi:hypothetical protein
MKAILLTIFGSLFLFSIGWTQTDDMDLYPPTPVPDRIILTLTEAPDTSMAVNWRTSLAVDKALVEVAKADPTPEFKQEAQLFEGTTTALLTDRNGRIITLL